MIDANLKNLQKCILWFCFLSKTKNKFSNPYRNEDTKNDFHYSVPEDLLKQVKAIKTWSKAVDFMQYNTSSNRLYSDYTRGSIGGLYKNNGNYQRMWCLWDSRTKFKFLGKGNQYAIYEVVINGVLIPTIEETEETLEEMYDLVREANFIERDYSDEEEHEDVFYFDELKPSAKEDNIIEIPFNDVQYIFFHPQDPSTWQYPFEEIINKFNALNSHERYERIVRLLPMGDARKILVDGVYFTNL